MAIGQDLNNPLGGMEFSHSGQCLNCAHYDGEQKCAAFPKGIPEAVFDDAVDHTVPVDGDNGIQFQAQHVWSNPDEVA